MSSHRSLGVYCALVSLAAGTASAATQQGRVSDRPPQILEDNAIVETRMAATPVEASTTHRPMREHSTGAPDAFYGIIDNTQFNENSGILGSGFDSFSSDFLYPADCAMDVGPTHVVTGSNSGMRIHTKTGQQTFSASWSTFFNTVRVGWEFVFQPTVLFDRSSQRWFAVVPAFRNIDYHTWFLIAVSDDANPNGTWKKYAVDSTMNAGQPTDNWTDFVRVGVDGDALVVSANMYDFESHSFQYAKVRAFRKSDLTSFAATLTFNDFWDISNPDGTQAFSLVPANHIPGPVENQAFFLINNPAPGTVNVWGMFDIASANPVVTHRALPVNTFGGAIPDASQPSTTVRLDTGDTRCYNAVHRFGRIATAHTFINGSVASTRWYEIDTADWDNGLSVLSTGTISEPNRSHWYPSVAINKLGTLAVGFSRVSASQWLSTAYAFRAPTDPPSTISAPVLLKLGGRAYTGEGGSPVRWGDYTATAVDPADDLGFWHYNGYPNPQWGYIWNSWVGQFFEGAQCAGDFDGNGFINGTDYDTYVGFFEEGGHQADFDHDGFVNSIDFDLYVNAYVGGC